MIKFAIVAKKNEKSYRIEEKVKSALCGHDWQYDKKNPELVICVGGDGTLLYAVHKYIEKLEQVKFVGIHTGTLGFFTDYTEQEVDICIHDIITKEPKIFESNLLSFKVNNKKYYTLNEMRIENIKRTQVLDVYVDGEFFEVCRGSGVCLSTQAGSTAYNRSLGGAVIDNGISLMQMTEITAIQHSKHRSLGNPYILKADREVIFKSEDFSGATLCYDHLYMPLKNVHEIICRMSNKSVKFARYREYSYLKRLKNLY